MSDSVQTAESREYLVYGLVAEEVKASLRAGRQPDVEALASQYPELAGQIRELVPTLAIVHQLGRAESGLGEIAPSAATDSEVSGTLGDYRILREIGRGGMGVVYEAEQISLGRRVALKVLPFAAALDSKQLQRFKNEAQAAAHLHHTNIVPVFAVGTERGVHFYAMQYIEGQTLAALIRERRHWTGLDVPEPTGSAHAAVELVGRISNPSHAISEADQATGPYTSLPLPTPAAAADTTPKPAAAQLSTERSSKSPLFFRTAANLGIQAALALEHAHQLGVVHRDIKPANLMVDGRGNLWITDFGLAHCQSQAGLTMTGDLVGTLRYMSPEQALAKRVLVDQRTDIYSLGVTLYELLTLEAAYQGSDRQELLRQIAFEEPRVPRRLNKGIPVELETIVLKAMEKNPADRYATAQELADDLRRYLEDKPIWAKRPTLRQRLVKLARRHKPVVATSAFFAVLLLALAVVGLAINNYLIEQEQALTAKERDVALDESNKATAARIRAETTLVDMQTARGLLAAEQEDTAQAVLWFANAAESAASDPQRQADNRLRARNWARNTVLPVAALSLDQAPRKMEFRPGGDLLLMLTKKGLLVWDWGKEKALPWADGTANVSAACWSPDGSSLALGSPSGEVQIRSVPGGAVLHQLKHPGAVTALAFSPNGRYLAAASNVVRIWDAQAGAFLKAAWQHPQPVTAVAFNRKGDRLVTACGDNKARVFAVAADADRPAPLFAPVIHVPSQASPPAFVDDDRGLVTITGDRQLTWWDAESGQPARLGAIATKPGGLTSDQPLHDLTRVVASPRGSWFATSGYYGLEIWNSTGGSAKSIHLSHNHVVEDFVFGPDGTTLLSACYDRTARLWSLPEGRALGSPLAHMGFVARCAFSADNAYLATCQTDGLLRIWKRPAHDVVRHIGIWEGSADHADWFQARVSFNGLLVSPGIWHEAPSAYGHFGLSRLVVLDAMTATPAGPPLPLEGFLVDSCVGADNRSAAAVSLAGSTGWLSVSDVPTGRALFPAKKLPGAPVSVASRPHGSHVAVLCLGGELLVFDGQSGKLLFDLRHDVKWEIDPRQFSAIGIDRLPRVEYTPDGATLVTLATDNAILVRDADTGRPRYPPIRPVLKGGPCRTFTISADSRLLATGVNWKNAAQVWELASGRALSQPLPHPGDLYGLGSIRFSPDGQHLLTGHEDGQARWWDWKAGRLACPPLEHGGTRRFGPGMSGVTFVSITADGRYAVTSATKPRRSAIHVWELKTGKLVASPLSGPFDDLESLGQFAFALTGREAPGQLYSGGGVALIQLEKLLAPPDMPTEDLRLLGELASAQRIELGDVSGLSKEQWLERWQRFRQKQPGFGRDDPPHLAHGRQDTALKRPDKAEADFTKALELKPSDPQAWIERGRYFAERGQREKADADFAKAATLTSYELNKFIEAGWWVVGPYPEDLKLACPPEKDPDPSRPVAAVALAGAGPHTLNWQHAPTGEFGRVELGPLFSNADHTSAYALTYVSSPEERSAMLLVDGGEAVRVWLNGRLVDEFTQQRGFQEGRVPVTLRAGRNTLLAKVSKSTGSHYLSLRIADSPVDRGITLAEMGLWDQAAPLFGKGFGRPLPVWDECWYFYLRAPLLLLSGNTEEYRRECAQVADRVGGAAWMLANSCGLAPEGSADPARLLKLAEDQLKTHPQAWVAFPCGLAYYRAGQFEKAIRRFSEPAGLDGWSRTWAVLAMAHHRLGHADEARTWLTKADAWYDRVTRDVLEGQTFNPWNHGDLWWEMAQFQVLHREAKKLIEGSAYKEDANLKALQARAREVLQKRDKATAEYDHALMLFPDQPRLWLARGRRFAELKRWDKADADLAKAAELAPADPEVRRERGRILVEPGRPELPPDDPRPWIERGRYFAEDGQRQKSEADFAKAATLTSDELNKFIEAGWWVVGPYPEDLKLACPPEKDPDPSRPVAAVALAGAGPHTLNWQHAPTGEFGRVELGPLFNNADHTSAYALTYVSSPEERSAMLLVGGGEAVRVWLNGRLVDEFTQQRGFPWEGRVPVTLRAGRNTLLAKVSKSTGSHYLSLRIADSPVDRGITLAEMGLWEEAAPLFGRPLSDEWNEFWYFHLRAPLLLLSGNTEAYRRECARMADRVGGAWMLVNACGLAPEGSADPARLVKLAEDQLKTDPQAWVAFPCGLAYYRAGQFEKAIRRFSEPAGLHGWPRTWAVLAMAHHRLGHADEARTWLTKADAWYDRVTRDVLEGQTFNPWNHGDFWWEMAQFQVLHREAKQLIEGSAYKEDANRKALQARAGEVLKVRDKATADYDLALMLHPELSRLWLARGRRLAELKRWDKADADLAKAVELKPDNPQVWKERGGIYAEVGQPDKAAADFAKALALVPTSEALPECENWPDRAGIDEQLVQWDEVFNGVVKLRPKDPHLWAARAHHYARRSQWPQAATAMAKVNELAPSVHLGWYLNAPLQLELGDIDGYRRTCREMLARFGGTKNPYIAERTAKTCLLVPKAVGNLKLVMKLADQAVTGTEKTEHYRWFVLAKGMADYRDGRFASAVTWLGKSLATDSERLSRDAMAHLFLAMAHHQLGRPDEARQSLDTATKMMAQKSPADADIDWHDWLMFQIVRREAEGRTKQKE